MPDTATCRRGLRVAALAAGVLAAAAAAECFLRLTHFGVWAPRTDDYGLVQRNDQDYWYFQPSHTPTQVWDRDPFGRLPPGARLAYRISADGLRGEPPAPGRSTVVVVGDSFTFGEGVPEQDALPAQTERLLSSRIVPAPAVVNAGIPGYGTIEEAARLPLLVRRFAPRAVVVVFVTNDAIPLDDALGRPDLLRIAQAPPALYLARLVRGVAERAQTNRAVEDWYASYYFGERRSNWDKARRALSSIKAQCDAANAHLGVAIFPLIHRLADRPFAAIHDAVAAACREDGTPCIDLTSALAREPDRALWLHPADHHPDAHAYGIAAGELAPFVESLLR